MDLVHPLAENYAAAHTSPEDALLHAINAQTQQHAQPHMLSGHVQGRLLEFISWMMQPKYILEIGTFTGYSALCLAKGLQPGGALHTIELREEDAALSRENFSRSDQHNLIHLHTGNALDIIPTLPHAWDLVFIDADKTGYTAYYEMLLPRLSKNGLIIADNVLFHGQVLETPLKGKNAKAIDAFNKHVLNDERSEQVFVTVRDGLLFIKKKQA
ncbi:O-methyltransferase [Deminuibacter soli]|uniref:O-methyltransferase n=1 Tax=Deminuibacter soli TaxID=2291815 RepID=A0A3E1NDX0_9BACT|nr:O-methyltransferase [Deminuibacter soli]RFM26062.1 O-methyltransferase [Deminuibacter soli]